MCYSKAAKSMGGLKMQTAAFNSFTCRGPKLFNRMPNGIREMKRLPQLSDTANILRFKNRLDKYLSCISDKPLNNGYPHCGDNSLLERNAEPGSDWQMWQAHENVLVTAREESVNASVG